MDGMIGIWLQFETNKNLNEHLYWSEQAVNKNLKGTIYPFKYNNYNQLEKIVNKHKDIGIIKMEV